MVTRGTHHFIHMLGQIRNVQIGRCIVTLGLQTRVEGLLRDYVSVCTGDIGFDRVTGSTYTSETNLISEIMETSDALLRVTDIAELGEPKSELALVQTRFVFTWA